MLESTCIFVDILNFHVDMVTGYKGVPLYQSLNWDKILTGQINIVQWLVWDKIKLRVHTLDNFIKFKRY